MRATGIVRRLDDLGRLVIPKEIRRVLGWKEGDPLELYCDRENKTIVLKKYEVEDDDGNMKKYRVGIEISGYVERCVEAEDGDEAQDIVLDSIDWDDVEFSCEECEEIKDNSRKKYKIKAKGEN